MKVFYLLLLCLTLIWPTVLLRWLPCCGSWGVSRTRVNRWGWLLCQLLVGKLLLRQLLRWLRHYNFSRLPLLAAGPATQWIGIETLERDTSCDAPTVFLNRDVVLVYCQDSTHYIFQ